MKKYLLEPGKNMVETYQAFIVYRLTEPQWQEHDQCWLEYTHESSSVMFNLSPAKGQITRWIRDQNTSNLYAEFRNEPPYRTVVQSWIEHHSPINGVEVLEYKEY